MYDKFSLPRISNYGQYVTDNYGLHTQCFTDRHGVTYYYSYETLVAIMDSEHGSIVRENVWGPTTGKHLNWIDGGTPEAHKRRLSSDEFNRVREKWGV